MSNPAAPEPWIHWRVAVQPIRQQHHELVDECVRWARDHDRLIDPDVLALLIAAAGEDYDQGPPSFWTKTRVSHMFCDHIDNWAFDNNVEWDDNDYVDRDREALWVLLTFLIETGRLHPDSHPPTVLFKQLIGVDDEGFATQNPRFWENDDPDGDFYAGPTYGEIHCRKT